MNVEWTSDNAEIETEESRLVLHFSFDCGPADNTAYDSVSIADLKLVRK